MAATAVALAAVSLLPIELRRLVVAGLIIFAASTPPFLVLWGVDRILIGAGTSRSLPVGGMVLSAVSATIMALASLPLPGSRGPIQYAAGNAAAMFFFDVRVVTILVLLICPIACGVIGIARLGSGTPFRFGWLLIAIATYALTVFTVFSTGFFPTA
jgi:hypothetical protein